VVDRPRGQLVDGVEVATVDRLERDVEGPRNVDQVLDRRHRGREAAARRPQRPGAVVLTDVDRGERVEGREVQRLI